jgi:2-iminobutanoate/2-iminopropanoate deaminase
VKGEVFDAGTTPPLGPLSRAVGAGDYVFVSGTIGTRDDGSLPPTIESQTEQTLENIASHLAKAGLSLADVVEVTVYLPDAGHYSAMNGVYERFFDEPCPARATVCCPLVHSDHLIEISAVAYRGEPS